MARLNSWLSADVMHALGWALIHSLWQCLALAALAAVLMAFSRRPSIRYLVATGALVAMLAAPVATFLILMKPAAPVHALLPPRGPRFLPYSCAANPPSVTSMALGAAPTAVNNGAAIALRILRSVFFRRVFSRRIFFPEHPALAGWWGRGFAASRSSVCASPAAFCFWNISAAASPASPALASSRYARICSTDSAWTAPSGIWNAAGFRRRR